jgi:hypothetical protein
MNESRPSARGRPSDADEDDAVGQLGRNVVRNMVRMTAGNGGSSISVDSRATRVMMKITPSAAKAHIETGSAYSFLLSFLDA